LSGSDSFFDAKKKAYISIGCDRSETIDIQSLQAAQEVAYSLSHQVVCDSPAYLGAFQANFFDGKSDGKILFGILSPKFTVSEIPGAVRVYKSRHIRNGVSPRFGNP